MTDHLLALIAAHFACSDMAETRALNLTELQYCSAVYQDIKISFVPGMTVHRYASLSSEDRSKVNKEGFLAFYHWRQDHPHMVDHLEKVARGEATMATAS